MNYIKYQHLERYGTDEVKGITLGECYIFPKLDGSNGQIWLENGIIKAGSRRRELSKDKDNAGFLNWVKENENKFIELFNKFPDWRLFGEWLVPHSLKTYRDSAWKNFYVFDVGILKKESKILHEMDTKIDYLHFKEWNNQIVEHEIDIIYPQAIINNPSYEQLLHECKANTYLIKDGMGYGEGIVIKNYEFKSQYNRQTWAKIVTNEFKEKNNKEMGVSKKNGPDVIEEKIIYDLLTTEMIKKTYSKIKVEKDGWKSSYIPQLLGRVWYDFITEESWNIVKKFKNPIINFNSLNQLCIKKIKDTLPELF